MERSWGSMAPGGVEASWLEGLRVCRLGLGGVGRRGGGVPFSAWFSSMSNVCLHIFSNWGVFVGYFVIHDLTMS